MCEKNVDEIDVRFFLLFSMIKLFHFIQNEEKFSKHFYLAWRLLLSLHVIWQEGIEGGIFYALLSPKYLFHFFLPL